MYAEANHDVSNIFIGNEARSKENADASIEDFKEQFKNLSDERLKEITKGRRWHKNARNAARDLLEKGI